jgi:hypothetical protein
MLPVQQGDSSMNRHTFSATIVATLGATLGLATTSALAGKPGGGGTGTYSPEIAYTSNQGSAWSVYLANADGTNPVAVYSRRSGSVGRVDFVPGSGPTGGQLVFQPTLGSISVLKYTASASGIKVISIIPLVTEQSLLVSSVDVSPDGNYVLYKVANGGNTSTLKVIQISNLAVSTVSTGYYREAVWSGDANLMRIAVSIGYGVSTGGLPRIEMFTLNPDFSFKTSVAIYGPCTDCTSIDIEFARTQDNVLFGVAGGASSGMWDVSSTGGSTVSYGGGNFPCFNANDTKIYYKNGSSVLYALDVGTSTNTKVSAGSINVFDVSH